MKILIIGAGIIGLTTARGLLDRGHQVLVVDRESAPGRVSSYLNGGQFSYTYAEPLASPAMLRQLPAMLLKHNEALRIHLSAFPELLPWSIWFLRHCTAKKFTENTQKVLQLARLSREEMERYRGEQAPAYHFRETGKLHLYRDPQQLQRVMALVKLKNALGFRQEIWNEEDCLSKEPALQDYTGTLAGGVFSPLDQSGDTFALVQSLYQVCQGSGRCGFHLDTEVVGFHARGSSITGVQTGNAVLNADAYILCAGAGSRRLLRSIGVRVPIAPVKGYSVTVPAHSSAPEINLTDTQHKIVFTKLADKLRIAGLMEFTGLDLQVRKDRIDHLLQLAKKVLPQAGDYLKPESSWAGLRPMTPDGAPIVGSTQWGNLWLNTGHGMLGSTLAFGSARHIADLLDGEVSPLDQDGFMVERFDRLLG